MKQLRAYLYVKVSPFDNHLVSLIYYISLYLRTYIIVYTGIIYIYIEIEIEIEIESIYIYIVWGIMGK